jgi:large subunit ribosomal protein L17
MNHAEVNKLVSALKFAIKGRHRQIRNRDGPEGRLFKMRKIVTAMFKYERIEMNYNKADEARGYAERVSNITSFM